MVKESRFLRSKRLRASLWYAADGKCQLCGCDMPSDWHADHIVRWAETYRTNVHEMQALCPQCHYTKTAQENRKMTIAKQLDLFSEPSHQQLNLNQQLNLRKHQAEFLEICKLIKAGQTIKKILMLVTPGGGKSLIPVIAAAQLIPNQPFQRGFHGSIADAICWIVPKVNLQKQGEENFEDSFFKQYLAHEHRVMANNYNEPNPCKGMSGYVATYQAIAANPDLHAQEFRRKRYILVLDEFHHVKEGGIWHRFLQPLVDQAVLLILVTGTHVRGDCQQIAFMPYKQTPAGVIPNLSCTEGTKIIEYKRSQALRERAIVPLHFEWGDGEAEWIDQTGQKCSVESFAEAGDYTSIALQTALSTGYARQLLKNCVDNWKQYKINNPRSKLLVLAPSISTANQYLDWLKELGINTAVKATSDQSKDAQAAIKKFKKDYQPRDAKAVDVLVTVAMAYEGLDVPAITHIACLTNIRSVPWLEQSWARAARVDRKAGELKSLGLIFIPDDQLARQCVEEIITEQEIVLKEKEQNERKNSGADNSSNEENSNLQRNNSIIPLNSSLTRSRASDLSTGESVDYIETEIIQSTAQTLGIGSSTITLKRFIEMYNSRLQQKDFVNMENFSRESLTPSEELDIIRENIENYVRSYAKKNGKEPKFINGEIVNYFSKSRKEMTLEELRQVWAWLQNNYPVTN
ncbi:MAG: DEAD/DEAH box helicase family protein [Nostoc sp. ChiSLP01]|nr:DEAD/DEAH box helicase family protein [Nostoc sp. CmiSLP01]MDZ8286857.1 DEAD/DEAH box helicase family protein [Nostoc sp. ChiSLP01]